MDEHAYRPLFESMAQGVVAVDRSLNLRYANPAARSILGLGCEPLTGDVRPCVGWRFFREDGSDLPSEEHPCRRVITTGIAQQGLTIGVFNNRVGENRWLNVTVVPNGSGAVAIFDDVTESRQVEQERQILMDVLALVNSPREESDLIFEIVGQLRTWSGCEFAGMLLFQGERAHAWVKVGASPGQQECDAACDGLRPDLLCARLLAGSLDPALGRLTGHGSFWSNNFQRAVHTVPQFRQRCCRLSAHETVALIPLRALSETCGILQLGDARSGRLDSRRVNLFENLAAYIASGIIQRRADHRMREAEARWQFALEGAGDGVWDWNEQTRSLYWSPQWKAMLGYADEDVTASRALWESLVHPDDLERVSRMIEQHLAGDTPSYSCDYRLRAKDGTYRWIHGRGKVISRTLDGKPVRFVGIHSDITARKQAEEALRQMDERYCAVLREQTDLICRLGPDQTFTFVNEAFCRYLNRPAEAIIGRSWRQRVDPSEGARIEAQAAALTRESPEFVVETRLRGGDGQFRWVQFVNRAIFDEQGRIMETQCVGRDIDALKRAEEALARKSVELDHYFEHSLDLLFIIDRQGRFHRANPEWERTLGIPVPELTRGTVFDLLHPDDVDATRAAFDGLIGKGRIAALVNRYQRSDGRYRFIEWRAYPVEDAIYGAGRDITEHKQAEEALRASEYWLRESQRVSRIGTYVFDIPNGRWTNSETLDEIFGIRPGHDRSVAGWTALIHPEHRAEMHDYLLGEVIGQGKPFNREYRIIRECDKKVVWVSGRGMLYCDPKGRPLRMVGTIQDITERKTMEEQLLQAQKMESIGRLAGGVAHDFNNLLTVINGYSDLAIARLGADDPVRRNVSEIRRAGERAVSLTKQLLAFSRRQILLPRLVDLNTLISNTEQMLRRLLNEDIQLQIRLDPDLGFIKADPGQIDQVLLNLTVNARDAMPDGGRLEIDTANLDIDGTMAVRLGISPGQYVQITVHDSGVGMDEATRRHLFEPFFTTKPTGSGTGLGLSTVYGIVQQSGGGISVQSEPGAGSTFRILLPRVNQSELNAAAFVDADPGLEGTETVLVVEDQSDVLQLTSAMLENAGYRVLKASSGREAIGVAESHPGPIHCLLTDVVMPGMSGWILASEVKQRRGAIRVAYMSGYTENAAVSRAMSEQGATFIQKPFTAIELAAGIRRALRGQGV